MAEVETQARRWGDSLAIIIPKDVVNSENIRPNDKIRVSIQKEQDLSDLFGRFKTKKTPQQLKDESRKDWD